jgi:hypothetical protein
MLLTHARSRRSQAPLLLAAGLIGAALAVPAAATAQPFYGQPYYGQPYVAPQRVPVVQARNWPAPYQDYPSQLQQPVPPPYPAGPTSWEEAQLLQQRCSTGRLIGGVVGGGLGYVASRQDGRAWAVPLGALLGSQMGCNAGLGRGPLPW